MIAEACTLPHDAVTVLPAAADADRFRPLGFTPDEQVRRRRQFGIRQPFILGVTISGANADENNLPRLFQAFAGLPERMRREHTLVIVIDDDSISTEALESEAVQAGIDDVMILTGLDDERLVAIYNLCKLAIFPALSDATGILPLAAMACGTPLIASNGGCLREVIGLDEALFSPHSVYAMCRALRMALEHETMRAKLRSHGPRKAALLSWEASAAKALVVFDRIVTPSSRAMPFGRPELSEAFATLCPRDIDAADRDIIAQALSQTTQEDRPRQLFIDISELQRHDARTGIQRRTRSLLLELMKAPPDGFVVTPVFATADVPGYRRAGRYTARLIDASAQVDAVEENVVSPCSGDIFLGLDLQQTVICAQAETLHRMRREGVQMVFFVDDLLPVTRPEFFAPGTDQAHTDWLKLVAQMDALICVSKSVADELEEWLNFAAVERLRPLRIGWVHNGADIENSAPSAGLLDEAADTLQRLAGRPTFLAVGTIEPRKGHRLLLEAFEQLWKKGIDINLAIVGKTGWMVESLMQRLRGHTERDHRLFLLEGISDEYLEQVYAASACLIAPSEGEGFGLPLIEAARRGLPLLVRDLPVFREVAGAHAAYFAGADAGVIAAAIEDWLAAFACGAHVRSEGLPWLTWKQSAERLKQLLLDETQLKIVPLRGRAPVEAVEPPPATLEGVLDALTAARRTDAERARRHEQQIDALLQAHDAFRQGTETALEEIRHRLDELARAETLWRARADELAGQCRLLAAERDSARAEAANKAQRVDDLLTSTSWRITAPFRKTSAALPLLPALPRLAMEFCRAVARRLVRRAIQTVVVRPKLRGWIVARIGRYPRLTARLRRLNQGGTTTLHLVPGYSPGYRLGSALSSSDGLSPHAKKIHAALMTAIERKERL